jgi:ribosomal protein L37AE/L43A
MPYCPKCVEKLSKRKSARAYYCKKHGFVRKIRTPTMESTDAFNNSYKLSIKEI